MNKGKNMRKRMVLELNFRGGSIEKEIIYFGASLEEIAANIEHDENELLQYMLTGDIKGCKSFCFAGFMFKKQGLIAAQFREPEF